MNLFIVGTGISGLAQITPETVSVLKRTQTIFILNPDTRVLAYVHQINPSAKIIDCNLYYEGMEKRPEVYDLISKNIIKECIENQYRSVAFVTYGHPLFLVSASEKLIEASKLQGINVTVYPAITSLDTLIADLQMEIGYCFSVFDATLILTRNIVLNPSIPVFIFQLTNLFDASIQRDFISYERLAPLRDHLLKFYRAEHEVVLVVSSHDIFSNALIKRLQLKDLCTCDFPALQERPSLFIPEQELYV